MEWQPIETAPKDESEIMLAVVRNKTLEEIHLGNWSWAANHDEVSCWWSVQDDDEIFPTHWAPVLKFSVQP